GAQAAARLAPPRLGGPGRACRRPPPRGRVPLPPGLGGRGGASWHWPLPRRPPKPVSRAAVAGAGVLYWSCTRDNATVGCPMDLQHRSPPPAVWCRQHRAIQAADATYARTLTLLATARQAV